MQILRAVFFRPVQVSRDRPVDFLEEVSRPALFRPVVP